MPVSKSLPAICLAVFATSTAAAAPMLDVMVLTDGPKLRRSEPWPSASPIFDPRIGRIDLASARNQTLGFQILLRPSPGVPRVEDVHFEVDALNGAAGALIEKSNLELFRAWFVQVREPSYTGGIRGLGPGEYPDPLVPLASPKYGTPFAVERPEMFFVDLRIPPGTPAGQYSSAISIFSGRRRLALLPIKLAVWNFTLPEETHFRSWFAFETEFLRWGLRKGRGESVDPIQQQLFRLSWKHRANLVDYTRLKQNEEEWETWAQRYAKYLDGSLYGESPGKGLGNYFWRLLFDAAEPEESLKPKLQMAADWLEKRGWSGKFVVVCFDEPKKDKYDLVRRAGRVTREATGGRLKHFLPGARPDPAFEDYVDVWDGVWVAEDLPALAARRRAGQSVWYCGGLGASANPVADSRAYGARSWAWVGWKYAFEGFEMWQSCYWVDKYNTPIPERVAIDGDPERFINVWKNPAPLTFDESRKRGGVRLQGDILQNGGAVFFYPGLEVGLPDQVVPSLRLKDFRRGVQDYEYLYLLREAGQTKLIEEALGAIYNPDAITLVRGGSPKIATGELGVTMDDNVWESVHRKMGRRLSELAGR